jgi:hypothetical protein
MKAPIVLAAAATLLAACATPTPYAASEPGGYGYSDSRIETNRFRVSFSGNSLTDRETVKTYLLYRASELTLEAGYDWFQVLDRETEKRTRYTSTGSPFGPPSLFHYRYYHPYYGWYPYYDPFWTDRTYREITRYEASAEIFMGRGEKPDDPNAFDAREVQTNLGPQIVYPEIG